MSILSLRLFAFMLNLWLFGFPLASLWSHSKIFYTNVAEVCVRARKLQANAFEQGSKWTLEGVNIISELNLCTSCPFGPESDVSVTLVTMLEGRGHGGFSTEKPANYVLCRSSRKYPCCTVVKVLLPRCSTQVSWTVLHSQSARTFCFLLFFNQNETKLELQTWSFPHVSRLRSHSRAARCFFLGVWEWAAEKDR